MTKDKQQSKGRRKLLESNEVGRKKSAKGKVKQTDSSDRLCKKLKVYAPPSPRRRRTLVPSHSQAPPIPIVYIKRGGLEDEHSQTLVRGRPVRRDLTNCLSNPASSTFAAPGTVLASFQAHHPLLPPSPQPQSLLSTISEQLPSPGLLLSPTTSEPEPCLSTTFQLQAFPAQPPLSITSQPQPSPPPVADIQSPRTIEYFLSFLPAHERERFRLIHSEEFSRASVDAQEVVLLDSRPQILTGTVLVPQSSPVVAESGPGPSKKRVPQGPVGESGGSPSKMRRKRRRAKILPSNDGPADSVLLPISLSSDYTSLGGWGIPGDIPTMEINSLAAPIGAFFDHMRQFAFDMACREFPWHLNWDKQCPELKAKFLLKLRKVYAGPWEGKNVLAALGGNLRERRCRLKKKFQTYKNWKNVPRPNGCSKESWGKIYIDTKDEAKKRKSKLCQAATQERIREQGYSHRCGPKGVKGMEDRFVEEFGRAPSCEESNFGKRNGWLALEARTTEYADQVFAADEAATIPPTETAVNNSNS